MRVLTVTNLYPPDVIGGYELGCHQMVEELRGRGHAVAVLTSAPRLPVPKQDDVHRELRLVDWHLRPNRPPVAPVFGRALDVQAQNIDAANVATLLRHVETHRPDVVYLWNVLQVGGFGLVAALAHLQVPVVWHLMDNVPGTALTASGTLVPGAGALLGRRLRARYLSCSERLRQEIEASGFPMGDRVELVPNWVAPLPERRDRRRFPFTGSRLRILFAGQLAPHKGVGVIIDAAQDLVAHGRTDFAIDLIGGGLTDHYRGVVLHHGLESQVRVLGSRDRAELAEAYWATDVFLFPTWAREPFGFAPLEAAAHGCVPLVSADCGYAEWVVDGVQAIKISRAPEQVSAVLAAVLDGRMDLEGIATRARRQIEEQFTVGVVADRVETAFEEALELPAVRPGSPGVTYHLARVAERLLQDWAETAP